MIYKKGDRIEMIFMGNDPDPIAPGSQGIITHISEDVFGKGTAEVSVDWDNGRSLSVCLPQDKVKKI